MEELTSRIARCASSASAFSTIARSLPSSPRTTRPYARGSAGSNESTVAVAPLDRCSSRSCPSNSGVIRGWSPETTSTSFVSPTLPRAERSESPVPSGRSWIATSTAERAWASAASGERTTTRGSGPRGRTAATTQSTSLRPSSGWRCFGLADFIRVPRPAAITTAASSPDITGAPGFEPGIAGPKPAALPLGYAPSTGTVGYAPSASRSVSGAAPKPLGSLGALSVREEVHEGDYGEDPEQDQRDRFGDRREGDP